MKTLNKILLAAGLALAATAAKADMVGQHFASLDGYNALIVQLSDTQGKGCQDMHRVLLSATNSRMLPQAIPYGEGCWYVTKGGLVVIEGKTFQDGAPIQLEYSVEDFEKTRANKGWMHYTGF